MRRQRLRSALLGFCVVAVGCGGGGAEDRGAPGVGDTSRGKEIYEKRCSQCHGEDGDGFGPAAMFMLPRPRVFKENAAYKFRRTHSGNLPTDWDLFDIISKGLPGTSMPAFEKLPAQERWDLIAYVKSLGPDFQDETLVAESKPSPDLEGLKAPEFTDDLRKKGADVFQKNKCWQCHGNALRGNGPSWPDLKDDWKNPILPTNLTNPEHFRGGASPEDIFRTVTTGLNGTPMPAYRESISVEDRWALVAYVVSFMPPKKQERDEIVRAIKVSAVPEKADDASWSAAPVARFKTLANVIEPPRNFWTTVDFVSVQAVYTDTEIGIRVQWDDRSESKGTDLDASKYRDPYTGLGCPKKMADPAAQAAENARVGWTDSMICATDIVKKSEHPDQFALRFPSKKPENDQVRPYFFFGDRKRSVNLWWWRGDQGKLTEKNAKGFDNVTEQPESSQELQAAVTYDDGRYTLVVRRALTTPNTKADVQFVPGQFVPIGFHAWDGGRGEVATRHALTTWYWLQLQPEIPKTVYYAPSAAFVVAFLLLFGLVASVRRKQRAAA